MAKRKQTLPKKVNADGENDVSFELENEDFLKVGPEKSANSRNKKRKKLEDPELERIVKNCEFYVSVFENPGEISDKINPSVAELGRLQFSCESPPKTFPKCSKCWLYVGELSHSSMIYFEDAQGTGKDNQYFILNKTPPYEVLKALRTGKKFRLCMTGYEKGEFEIGVWIRKSGLAKMKFRSDALKSKPCQDMQIITRHFYNIGVDDFSNVRVNEQLDIECLYRTVKELRQEKMPRVDETVDPQHRKLIPKLRPYQAQAVRWMLAMERMDPNRYTDGITLYEAINLPSGDRLYYNKFAGYLCEEMPVAAPRRPGGILADEMGLGKTIEVLSCVLCNPRPEVLTVEEAYVKPRDANTRQFSCICGLGEDRRMKVQCCKCRVWQHSDCVNYVPRFGSYYCPHCWVTNVPVVSRATLIVVPATIGHQWVEEIFRHVNTDNFNVLVYQGVHNVGFVQPPVLADNDVVIITYDTLRKELDYVNLPNDLGTRFRNPKRYMSTPSPLVAVDWWRVCLDEAQTVECPTAKTALMALKLTTVNRWCVTGTPFQRSLKDLYGLILFLGVEPYWQEIWWRQCLLEPFLRGRVEPMYRLIADVMWRTAKKDVVQQIRIPNQTEEIHWLAFSPAEEYFYRRQHAESSQNAVNRLAKFPDLDLKVDSLNKEKMAKVLAPLLRLRQACSHPQAVAGQFLNLKKKTMTMDKLLESLTKKTKGESEEANRLHLAALNGLAGIRMIQGEYVLAIELYREVLRHVDENKERVKTDKLQRLHALHNLSEVLDVVREEIPPTLRDSELRTEEEELRSAYLAKYRKKVSESREILEQSSQTVKKAALEKDEDTWWVEVLLWAHRNKGGELVDKVKAELGREVNVKKFKDTYGLQYVLVSLLDELNSSHEKLLKAIESLEEEPSRMVVDEAVECHLRPSSRRHTGTCVFCRIQKDIFERYENALYNFTRNAKDMDSDNEDLLGQQRQGTWADGAAGKILKSILTFARSQGRDNWVENGQRHIKLLDMMKKEFKGLRGVWMALRDLVSALDELSMATVRLRLRFPGEPITDPPQLNILEPAEVSGQCLRLVSDRVVGKSELERKLGQLIYLENLSNNEELKSSGRNTEPCPICQNTLGQHWTVLQCGHCFCIECMQALIKHNRLVGPVRSRNVKCAICRQTTSPSEISYVDMSEGDEEGSGVKVMGNHSTKIEAVVRTLINIKQKDPKAKALVFSSWIAVLDVLKKAFDENGVTYECIYSHRNFQRSLGSFKEDEKITALLVNIQTKANGLNLVEATHVLLVDPALNTANELQAIGRVHRIGQTKPTVVHRFIVRRTIEERMHEMLNSKYEDQNGNLDQPGITLRELRSMFTDAD